MRRSNPVVSAIFAATLVLAITAGGIGVPATASTLPAGSLAHGSQQVGTADVTIFLLGDAGKAKKPVDPLLAAMESDVEAARRAAPSGEVAVAYLGDNVYENGVPAGGSSGYEEYVRRLMAQVNVLGERSSAGFAPVRGIFVPGNHDWAGNRYDGWERIRRQEDLLSEAKANRGVNVALLPVGGCPGPAVVDVGSSVRLIAIDTQWWLRTGPKPVGADSPCSVQSAGRLLERLDAALASAEGRLVFVLAHHPVVSGGPHGGYLALKEWFWPTYNLLYYPYRKLSSPLQDLDSEPYAAMIAGLMEVYAKHEPLLMASGHDHNLQVIEGNLPRYQLVSGSGSKRRAVDKTRDPSFESLFWSDLNGYMRLDVYAGNRVRLTVTVVEEGAPREAFSLWLEGLGSS